MTLNVSAWSIRNPLPTILLFAVMCAAGAASFSSLPVMRYPAIDVTEVTVKIGLTGSAPAELESQVTRKVEDGLASIAGIRHLSSTVLDGRSTTTAEFQLGIRPEQAVRDVTDAVAELRDKLPRTIDEPLVQRKAVQGSAILAFAVEAPSMTAEQLSWFVDRQVLSRIQGIEGVGRAERLGGVTREIAVRLDPDKLMALGITASEVNTKLRLSNVNLTGGTSRIGDGEQIIRTLASAPSVEALKATRISIAGGRTLLLSDVATVEDRWEDPRTFAQVNGKETIAFAVYRSTGASDVSISKLVAAEIAKLTLDNPGLTVLRIDDNVGFTLGNYSSAMSTLYEGAALAVIVVFFFLRDWRATLIAGLTLPLAAIPTFWAMSHMGFSLNRVTLLSITLVTGVLVDDAIVEIENIVRHMRMGKTPYRAAMEAADEIGFTVVVISAAVIFVFVPVSFMPGIAGQYFKQFGLTIAVAVFFSLLVARLVTPLAAAYFLRPHPTAHRAEPGASPQGVVMRLYLGLLSATLGRGMRWLVLVITVLLTAGALWSIARLPSEFLPKDDDSRLIASIELPPGQSLDATAATSRLIAETVGRISEVTTIYIKGGVSAAGLDEPRRADIVLGLAPKASRDRSEAELQTLVANALRTIPDIRYSFDNQTTVALVGPDGDSVAKGAAVLERLMRADPIFASASALTSFGRPELRVVPKPDQPSTFGVEPSTIAETVRIATTGDSSSNLANFTIDGRQIPIRVQVAETARSHADLIGLLQIPVPGGSLPLSALADIRFDEGLPSIERYDRQNLVTIGFDPAHGRTSGEGTDRIAEMAAAGNLPPGVHLRDSGDGEMEAQMFADFATAMGSGIVLVYVVLVLLFRSVLQPVTILVSLPLSVLGVVAALLLTGSAFSLPVVIGLLMLMGIVTKNAIMLVDFANGLICQGIPRTEALLEAGRTRARPVVMTTLAMIAGMVPSALGVGVGGEFRAPMAVAVVGGLLASTVLSLVVVPSFFTIMEDISSSSADLFQKTFKPNQRDPAPNCENTRRFSAEL